MPFNYETWKSAVTQRLQNWWPRFTVAGVNSVYGFVAAASLWPLVEAWQRNPADLSRTALSILVAVGANLAANQLQAAQDAAGQTGNPLQDVHSETDLALKLDTAITDNAELRDKLDEVLEELQSMETAGQALAPTDRQQFVERLRDELTHLGTANRYSAVLTGDNNAQAQYDSQAAASGGIAAQTLSGQAATGDNSRQVQAQNYTENNYWPDPRPASNGAENNGAAHLHRYLEKLIKRCNALPLAALGGESSAGAEVRLADVYIALDTTATIKVKPDRKPSKNDERLPPELDRDRERPYAALEAAVEHPRLVLLGDPGSGKSSFANYLIAQLAAVQLDPTTYKAPPGLSSDLVPLFLTLRDVSYALADVLGQTELTRPEQDQAMLRVLYNRWRTYLEHEEVIAVWPLLQQALERGRVLLVLDGLDEMPEAQYSSVWRAVGALLTRHPGIARVIVTCRTRSYNATDALDGFNAYELAPFTPEQVQRFVAAWYQTQVVLKRVEPELGERRRKDLQQAVKDPYLHKLASNPMLLTTMAIIHQRGSGLPKQRVELYREAVNVLTHRWQEHRGLAIPSAIKQVVEDYAKLRPILEQIALAAHDQGAKAGQGGSADLKRGDLIELLEKPKLLGDTTRADCFLDYIDQRAGILVGQGGSEKGQRPRLYSFSHRTFQEYLAGCSMLSEEVVAVAFANHAEEGEYWHLAAKLALEELHFNRPVRQILDHLLVALCPERPPRSTRQWRLSLWAGHLASLDNPAQFGGKKFQTTDGDGPLAGEEFLKRLQDRLLGIMRDSPLPPVDRAEAGRLLAQLGDPRIEVTDPRHIELLPVPAGEFLIGDERKPLDIPYDFRISRYPITNAQYDQFVAVGGYGNPEYWTEAKEQGLWQAGRVKFRYDNDWRTGRLSVPPPFNLANHPAVMVTWYEALAFARWLNDELHQHRPDLLPPDWCVRLPTEAEWEKAARGPDGLEYPWGPDADPNRANYDDTNIRSTSAVGCFPAGHSPYQVEEMAGNVWEWTRSLYKPYPYMATDGRENLDAPHSEARVLRGGSYFNQADFARGASRSMYAPGSRNDDIGFRVVASPFTSGLCDSGH